MTRPESISLILKRLDALGIELNKPELRTANESTRLFGDSSSLDSMGLVTLIADLEEDIRLQFNISVTLVDEKAMSRLTSPFRNVNHLADYIVLVVNSKKL
jgi:acyl carrier protein